MTPYQIFSKELSEDLKEFRLWSTDGEFSKKVLFPKDIKTFYQGFPFIPEIEMGFKPKKID